MRGMCVYTKVCVEVKSPRVASHSFCWSLKRLPICRSMLCKNKPRVQRPKRREVANKLGNVLEAEGWCYSLPFATKIHAGRRINMVGGEGGRPTCAASYVQRFASASSRTRPAVGDWYADIACVHRRLFSTPQQLGGTRGVG